MTRNPDLAASLRIAALFLLAAGALAGYVWFVPAGIALEVAGWIYAAKYL